MEILSSKRGLPPPRTFRIGVRRSFFWLSVLIVKTIRELTRAFAKIDPAKGDFVNKFTTVAPSRDHRHSERFINEYWASEQYDHNFVTSIPATERKHLAEPHRCVCVCMCGPLSERALC